MRKVIEERALFDRVLPELLETIPGKWVVFHNGEVRAVYDDEDEAYVFALETLGRDAGFLLTRVEESRPIPMTAAIMFGTR